jgi:hypothetical protein
VQGGNRRYVLLPTGAGEEREISIPELKGLNLVYGWSRDDATLFLHGPDRNNGFRNYLWNAGARSLQPFGPDAVADDLPFVAPDRQQILERGPDRRWWVYRVDGAPGKLVQGLDLSSQPLGWREDGRSLYVMMRHDGNGIDVSTLDIDSGKLSPWKQIHPSRPVDDADELRITPDGKGYAYNYRVKRSELYVASGLK